MKRCSECKISKPYDEFHKNKAKKDGWNNQCKPCTRARNQSYKLKDRAGHSLKEFIKHLRKSYGLSYDYYTELYEKQNGQCAICCESDDQRLSVDHCHKTGRIRGLLCKHCNFAIGQLSDDPVLLRKAASYLEQ